MCVIVVNNIAVSFSLADEQLMVGWSFARVFRETVFGHLFHCAEGAARLA